MKNPSNWLKNALFKLNTLVANERRIGVRILELLFEIEQRKAYAELGYDGIFSFCVRELKFTDSQAFQRIQAMRALNLVPALKEKIESGSMSVSTISQIQVHLRQEQAQGIKYTVEEKRELFNHFENKTSQEVKRGIQELKGTRIRTKLILELDEEAENLWKEFKATSIHQTMGDDLNAFKLLLKSWLKSAEDKKTRSNPQNPRDAQNQRTVSGSTQPKKKTSDSRHVPEAIRREVFERDQFKCTQCGSTHALTIEHLIPYAKGGRHKPDNLKVLCRSCNLHQGVLQFGVAAMKRGSSRPNSSIANPYPQ